MVFCELIDFSDNILSPFFQVVGDHLRNRSTIRTFDFRILLKIGNFNVHRVAAPFTFDRELDVADEI